MYDFSGRIFLTDIFFIPRMRHASERSSLISAPAFVYSSFENILKDEGCIMTRKLCASISDRTWAGLRGTLVCRKTKEAIVSNIMRQV